MNYPTSNPKKFFSLIQNYKETQLLFAAIRLKIFDYLKTPQTATSIAKLSGYNERNLALFLNSLTSIGLINKSQQEFSNTVETELFLTQSSSYYLGEYFLFWEKMTSLENVESLVRSGPIPAIHKQNDGKSLFDFAQLARLSAIEIKTGRLQSFLAITSKLIPEHTAAKILDLGGGSGMLAIEFIKKYPSASGYVFEQPNVALVAEEFIHNANLQKHLGVMRGDFMQDAIGENYSIIIASGILDFASNNLQELTNKLAKALAPKGYLYLVSHQVNDDCTAPKESIVGWLASHLAGLNILQSKSAIEKSLANSGFKKVELTKLDTSIKNLIGEVYQID